jgi:ATP-dependent RNA helicase DDX1
MPFSALASACRRAGPHIDSPENWSEAVKRLKPRLLQRLADTLKMDSCLVFVRTNFDADNLEKFLNDLGAATTRAAYHSR